MSTPFLTDRLRFQGFHRSQSTLLSQGKSQHSKAQSVRLGLTSLVGLIVDLLAEQLPWGTLLVDLIAEQLPWATLPAAVGHSRAGTRLGAPVTRSLLRVARRCWHR